MIRKTSINFEKLTHTDALSQILSEITPEGRRMILIDIYIFIEMETNNSFPGNIAFRNQCAQHVKL